MNHPDLYFPSHTPESTAQNKATGKKLCSSFTSLAPVAPSNSAQHCKLQRHPSRNPHSEQWKSGHGNTRKMKRQGTGKENQLPARDRPAFDGKDNEAVSCTFFTEGLGTEKG